MLEVFDRRQSIFGWVVLGVCAILAAAVLLPALQFTIVDRRGRSPCVNNAKELAFAVTNFEGAKRVYPGYQSYFGLSKDRGKIGSWVVTLSPYMMQESLAHQYLADCWDDATQQSAWEQAYFGDAKQREVFYPEIPDLQCPSDKSTKASNAKLSYAVNAGFVLMPEDPALALVPYTSATSDSERSTISQRAANGVFNNHLRTEVWDPRTQQIVAVYGPQPSKVNSSMIADGLTQTIMVAENSHGLNWRDISIDNESARYRLGIVWLYATDKETTAGRPKAMPLSNEMKLTGVYDGKPVRVETARPSSFHPSVFVVGMLDGSTKTMDVEIDYRVYQALMTPQTSKSDMPDPSYRLKDSDFKL